MYPLILTTLLIANIPTTSDVVKQSQEVEQGEVLGSSTQRKECKIYVFGESSTWDCDLDIGVSKVKYLDWGNYLTLEIEGTYPSNISSKIFVYGCKPFTLTDSSTWFGCKQILVDSYESTLKLIYSGYIQVSDVSQSNPNFIFSSSNFFLKYNLKSDISKKGTKLILRVYSQTKGKQWTDIYTTVEKEISLPKLEKVKSTKPFSFPLDRKIGVTQWHGCTKYMCPHKGIDFGARLNKVISIGDGTVVKVGFDKYGGECNQGGRYVIVKHTNGMYSTYFHLHSYSVKVGSKLKKGSLIGISGNSGKWNCQNLGYHLHFETRKGVSSSTHVNPVEYIEVDWNTIPTLGYKQYPKRLSGNNPHPNF